MTAINNNTIPKIVYGVLTVYASIANAAFLAVSVIVANSASEYPLVKINLAPIAGANATAKPLKDCTRFNL